MLLLISELPRDAFELSESRGKGEGQSFSSIQSGYAEPVCMAGKHCSASVTKPLSIRTIASIPSLPTEKGNSNPTKPMSPQRKWGGGGNPSPALG